MGRKYLPAGGVFAFVSLSFLSSIYGSDIPIFQIPIIPRWIMVNASLVWKFHRIPTNRCKSMLLALRGKAFNLLIIEVFIHFTNNLLMRVKRKDRSLVPVLIWENVVNLNVAARGVI